MTTPPPVAGIIGLGLVGQALGTRLRAAGWHTLGYDLRAEAREAFAQAGGIACETVQAVGREAQSVVLAVFETRDVLDVLEGQGRLLTPGHRVRTLVDCSTGTPELLAALSLRLQAQGIDFIEAPLSGSSEQIGAGLATMLLGGEDTAITRATPLLQALSEQRLHVGGAGAGARAKLATNLVLGLNRAALAEGMAYAQALGIAPERFLALVLATPARSAAAEVKGPLMVRGDFAPQSRIRQHLKDVDLMLSSAQAAGLALPLSEAHAELMRRAVAEGDGDLDNAAIIRRYQRGAPKNKD